MKVVSSAKISEKHLEKLKKKYPNVNYCSFENMEEAQIELDSADILITYGEDLTEDIINRCTSLKWIQIISAGIDKIPFDLLKQRGITVTNAKGIHYIPMSEYTLGVILQLARRTNEIYRNQLNKTWDRSIRVEEIYEKTMGIVGLGSIGQGIAYVAKAFNMKVIGMNKDGRSVDHVDKVYKPDQLKELMADSDYVVVIVPLTKETFHLIGKDEIGAMKNTAYLINIARGSVIDEEALVEALKNNVIAGAALDVFSEEPLPENHPLWSLDNCIITPHLSGRSPRYMERALEIFDYNLELYLRNQIEQMRNLVNLNRGY